MLENENTLGEDRDIVEVISTQLQHFQQTDPPCRGMQLPDGVLLRYTQAEALYFYLLTTIDNGKFRTQVFASDSPYDRQKATIGVVLTPLFDVEERTYLERVENMIRSWVAFVKRDISGDQDFHSFTMEERPS